MPTPRRNFILATLPATLLTASPLVPALTFAAEQDTPVTATEDLMREHGILRRALLVYVAIADRLTRQPASVPAQPLVSTARLFREFGEDYHERKLEEKFIFPAVRKLKSPAARYPDVLQRQHDRGRQLTDYVLRITKTGSIASGEAEPLARALRDFTLMYQHHTAREDTVVFPAWKDALSANAYEEMGEQFEAIEKQVFGHDGFEDALKRITQIEQELGLADISQFTISEPPK